MENLYTNQSAIKRSFLYLAGGNSDFKAEHQFFNISCLFGFIFYLFFIAINIVFKIDKTLTFVKLGCAICSIVIYYFSRYKRKLNLTSFLFFLIVLFSLLFIGLKNGGVTGGIAPIYTAVLALMLFINEGFKRIVLLAIWFLSISSLFVFEYFKPEFIVPYTSVSQKYIDIYFGYLSGIVMMSFVVVLVKKLYKKEKLNAEELIKKYRKNGIDLKEIINGNKKFLTYREREICNLILQGNTNKEIALNLFIAEGTVKQHVNKIYKKLGASNRVEVINHIEEI